MGFNRNIVTQADADNYSAALGSREAADTAQDIRGESSGSTLRGCPDCR